MLVTRDFWDENSSPDRGVYNRHSGTCRGYDQELCSMMLLHENKI